MAKCSVATLGATTIMLEAILDDFFWRALLGGLGVALVAGPLGCFVVWRRMSYFGDTLAHSALLGVALGTLFQVDLNLGIALVCVAISLILTLLARQRSLATDTLLGILSHSTLAIGLVAISFLGRVQVDLNGYLFGDLLAISRTDLAWIAGGAITVGLILWRFWSALLMATIHEELAKVEGLPVERLRLLLMVMFSLVIAVSMKIVGVLLITALLIIPAATARPFSRSPERMAALAALLGAVSVISGLGLSWTTDTPAGPSVVVAAFMLFLAGILSTRGRGA
ncbi:iron chelate uptake ABC transporter family permease subunit [Hydrocarboniclastica marina]|nr:iron chelate uptake ABC transporter family permease subunit [Hydrocarboniclastica marina]